MQVTGKSWEEAARSRVQAFCLWVSEEESSRPLGIFLALAWVLTSQKERGLGAALTCRLFPFPAQRLLPVPCHSTVMSDATSVSHTAEREEASSSTHC